MRRAPWEASFLKRDALHDPGLPQEPRGKIGNLAEKTTAFRDPDIFSRAEGKKPLVGGRLPNPAQKTLEEARSYSRNLCMQTPKRT